MSVNQEFLQGLGDVWDCQIRQTLPVRKLGMAPNGSRKVRLWDWIPQSFRSRSPFSLWLSFSRSYHTLGANCRFASHDDIRNSTLRTLAKRNLQDVDSSIQLWVLFIYVPAVAYWYVARVPNNLAQASQTPVAAPPSPSFCVIMIHPPQPTWCCLTQQPRFQG